MELITAVLVACAYVGVNALILAFGIGLNRLGSVLGRRRAAAPVVT